MLVKDELLDKVSDRIREQMTEDQAPLVEEFTRQYYGWVDAEDLEDRSPIDAYGAALSHWSFAGRREPGEWKIRVYNPQFEEHGWQSTHTVVEMVNDDMPFLVDSTRMEINSQGYAIHMILHPVMKVRRDEEGQLIDVLPPDADEEDAIAESVIHVEVDRQTEPEVLEDLRGSIEKTLADVKAAVEDWLEMRERVGDIVSTLDEEPPDFEPEDLAETRAFLEWIDDDNFTFLGYREYELTTQDGEDALCAVEGSGLGILRQTNSGPISHSFAELPPEVRRLARTPKLLNLTKANSRATVHRPSYLDYIGIKKFDESGEVTGERRFLGLYTFTAYSSSVFDVPLIRRKVRYVLERSGFPEGSHNEKDLIEILETYPPDELFQISTEELFEIAMGILHLQERQRVRFFVRRDTYGRFFSCLVFVPRDRYNTVIRERMQDILLRAFEGVNVEFNVRLSESVLARIHFIIYTKPGETPEYDEEEIERRLVETTRSWTDNLYDALIEHFGEERGTELFSKYRDAFPPGYRAGFLPRTAVSDIQRMEALKSEDDLEMSLYHPIEESEDFLGFKLFRLGEQVSLSEILPLLEDMGVEVVDERPPEVKPAGSPPVWIYDFGLVHEAGDELQTGEVREIFQDAFARAWRGAVENDGFNRLVLRARLTWREISVLRAYCKYLRQTGSTFSQDYMEDALVNNHHIARLIVDLFEARLDPSRQNKAETESERLTEEIEEALEEVVSLDEDRILSSFLGMTLATLRTNYYQNTPDGDPKPHLSFKLDPERIPGLPRPLPRFEIFVYSPRTEGVHLRGGEVARGGIRWSDRREDFRTEILGLMKAQTVKNAVIVPVGAKGGFVVKRPPTEGGREALQQEVVACYKTLIRGMLDITDNISGDEIVPPPDVRRYDDDDPYLVVAADKGTATFSDIANGLSAEYGFWLGDAFASGGSVGYDHKEMGITARGAWESVSRHFRELGRDIQNEDFTVVGIGDMSGDVFGNGMLLSQHIRLVAAFDHRHVFLDPNPDVARSWNERKRMFGLPRSTWDDYDKSLISEGGGVYSREQKSIPISPQVRTALGIEDGVDELPPPDLLRRILKAPVDLLWNGGIGTYIKAETESDAEVGDRANDMIRVNGNQVRAKVLGEGGNLGVTSRGRIEFDLSGGRINTDAMDNSAGVDCSDHEVNIKILIDALVSNGKLQAEDRTDLLLSMTDEVGQLVLEDNEDQNDLMGTSRANAASLLPVHARMIKDFVKERGLNRELEALPSEKEIRRRTEAGLGLTSPELATLMAHVKLALKDEVLGSELPDQEVFASRLPSYFPVKLRDHFASDIRSHQLRREIVTTMLVNDLVDTAGITYAYRISEDVGVRPVDAVRSYVATNAIFRVGEVWRQIRAADVSVAVSDRMTLDLRRLIDRAGRWLLNYRPQPLAVGAEINRFAEKVATLTPRMSEWLRGDDKVIVEKEAREMSAQGVSDDVAYMVATGLYQYSLLDVIDIADIVDRDPAEVADTYFALMDRLGTDGLLTAVSRLVRDDRWHSLARLAIRDDIYGSVRALCFDVLAVGEPNENGEEKIAEWEATNSSRVSRAQRTLTEIYQSGELDLATLSVAARQLRSMTRTTGTGQSG